MKNYEDKIYKEINIALKALKRKRNLQLNMDLSHLYFLCEMLNFSSYKKRFKIKDLSVIDFYSKYISDFQLNSYLIETHKSYLQNFFSSNQNDIEYKYTEKLNIRDSIDLALEFLENFNIDYYNTLKNLNERLIVLNKEDYQNEDFSGTALCGNSKIIKPKILIFDTNTIITPLTIAHETSHIYDFSLNQVLTNKQYLNKLLSVTTEINSYYTELHFYDYLANLYDEDIKTCRKDFSDYFYYSILDVSYLISNTNQSFIKYIYNFDNYVDSLRDFYGRLVAYILYSLDDLEKGNYICDNIMNHIQSKPLEKILLEDGINIKDDIVHEKVFNLIKKHWN